MGRAPGLGRGLRGGLGLPADAGLGPSGHLGRAPRAAGEGRAQPRPAEPVRAAAGEAVHVLLCRALHAGSVSVVYCVDSADYQSIPLRRKRLHKCPFGALCARFRFTLLPDGEAGSPEFGSVTLCPCHYIL